MIRGWLGEKYFVIFFLFPCGQDDIDVVLVGAVRLT